MKTCKRCEKEMPLTAFHKHKGKKDGLRSHCKLCTSDSFRIQSMDPNYKKMRMLAARRRRLNPEYKKKEKISQRKTNLKRSFGITVDSYNLMFQSQGGKCGICERDQSEFKRRFAVDHCHKTKKIRKLLCDFCNPGLGYFRDSKELFTKAIKYLEDHS